MSEGEAGHEMFLIMKGTVAISKGGQVLGQLSDGSFFGEMGLLSGTRAIGGMYWGHAPSASSPRHTSVRVRSATADLSVSFTAPYLVRAG